MVLGTPEGVRKLQRALHAKAKGSPGFRFYSLYDKVYREDILRFAFRCCRANGGAPGVDGEEFEDIEEYGEDRWLGELAEELRRRTYRPQAVRRVFIPKPNGKRRPLGIPTIRDRVVQTAAVLVLEPIFEADLQPEQYAYRRNRSALDAIEQVYKLLRSGHLEVIDADLRGYFDSIPHSELMKSVARRVSDRHMLHLIKMWLTAPVEERDERGRRIRTTNNKDTGRGIPQGAPISPLLANIYMRRFVLGWKVLGYEKRCKAHIVNYADDYVICCRRGRAEEAMAAMRRIMGRIKLEVNEEKTSRCRVPEEAFDFLGYTFGICRSFKTGRAYIGTRPSRRSLRRIIREISEATSRRWLLLDAEMVVKGLNEKLTGWAQYFKLGPVSKAYRALDLHTSFRLRRWLCGKYKRRGKGTARYPNEYLYEKLGLVRLSSLTRSFPWAKA
jgi:RNA-directed DNA polymerase